MTLTLAMVMALTLIPANLCVAVWHTIMEPFFPDSSEVEKKQEARREAKPFRHSFGRVEQRYRQQATRIWCSFSLIMTHSCMTDGSISGHDG